jgi:1-acyl-sn-glycerol-3-phosphate acyltransferase
MKPAVRLRRAVMLPVILIVEVLVVVTSPITVMIAAVFAVALRSARPVRAVVLVVAFASIELTTLTRMARGVEDWDGLVATVLDSGYRAMSRILDVPLVLEDGSPTAADLSDSNGLIVLARHCGPGDSVYIAWLLAVHYRLSIRIVLKRLLRLEPTLDLAADHIPLCFVGGGAATAKTGIAEMAAALGHGDALLLFPEGRNFSWPRWHAAIEHLRAQGQLARAHRASRRTHTLPPRLGGALSALRAAPNADVLLLAHSGFSADGRDRPWWRVPMHHPLIARTVLIPAAQVPRTEDEAGAFLDRAWARVDHWVEDHADLLQSDPPPEP